MIYKFEKHARVRSTGAGRLILPILIVASLTGCAAMEGINVGANIPIGGVVNVGANKTIGDGQTQAQTQKKAKKKSDESAPEEE